MRVAIFAGVVLLIRALYDVNSKQLDLLEYIMMYGLIIIFLIFDLRDDIKK